MNYYCQCVLEKEIIPDRMVNRQVSWIPAEYAKEGKVLKLKNDDGEWVDGWVVMDAGPKTPENQIPDVHNNIKAHRRATGDSLKK